MRKLGIFLAGAAIGVLLLLVVVIILTTLADVPEENWAIIGILLFAILLILSGITTCVPRRTISIQVKTNTEEEPIKDIWEELSLYEADVEIQSEYSKQPGQKHKWIRL